MKTLKLQLGDEIRRLTLPRTPFHEQQETTLEFVHSNIFSLFHSPASEFVLTYLDEEGDVCLISQQAEMDEALRGERTSLKILLRPKAPVEQQPQQQQRPSEPAEAPKRFRCVRVARPSIAEEEDKEGVVLSPSAVCTFQAPNQPVSKEALLEALDELLNDPEVRRQVERKLQERQELDPIQRQVEIKEQEEQEEQERSLEGDQELNLSSTAVPFCSSTIHGFPDIHAVHHLNNGAFGNSNSWIPCYGEDVEGIHFAGLVFSQGLSVLSSVSFGRDKSGTFTDRLGHVRVETTTDKDPSPRSHWQLQVETMLTPHPQSFNLSGLNIRATALRLVVHGEACLDHIAVTGVPLDSPKSLPKSAFCSDVTIPDRSVFQAGDVGVKVWEVRNSGSTAWPEGCNLVPVETPASAADVGNEVFELPSGKALDSVPALLPNQGANLSVQLTMPTQPGLYRRFYRLATLQGQPFGDTLWVLVQVENKKECKQEADKKRKFSRASCEPAMDLFPNNLENDLVDGVTMITESVKKYSFQAAQAGASLVNQIVNATLPKPDDSNSSSSSNNNNSSSSSSSSSSSNNNNSSSNNNNNNNNNKNNNNNNNNSREENKEEERRALIAVYRSRFETLSPSNETAFLQDMLTQMENGQPIALEVVEEMFSDRERIE